MGLLANHLVSDQKAPTCLLTSSSLPKPPVIRKTISYAKNRPEDNSVNKQTAESQVVVQPAVDHTTNDSGGESNREV